MNDRLAAVGEYSSWVCLDKKEDILHVRRYNNQVYAACGRTYPKWWFFPVITLNDGSHEWCDNCIEGVEDHLSERAEEW